MNVHMSVARRWRWQLAVALLLSSQALASIWAADADLAVVERIEQDVEYLASDELEGRGPGTSGIVKAAEYIRNEFREAGLKSGTSDGTYMQPFSVPLGQSIVAEETKAVLHTPGGEAMPLEIDHGFRPFYTGEFEPVSAPIVFAGYGISAPDLNYDDYRDLNVEGKIVLIIRREPQQDDPESKFDGEKTTSHSYFATKLKQAVDHKAAGVLLVNDPHTFAASGKDDLVAQQGLGLRDVKIPFAQLTIDVVNKMLSATPITASDGQKLDTIQAVEAAINATGKPLSQVLDGWQADLQFTFKKDVAETANVVGVLEGEGPLADETVVIGAHYDHLGYGGFGSRRPNSDAIHNGADDNASGTAVVMELARRFAQRDARPPRRIVFIAFSGEERGLIGSNYYVDNPLFPIENTIAMLNFDMVGTLRNNELGVHGTGSGEGLSKVVEQTLPETDLVVKQGDDVISASDHFSFYQGKVPIIFFFTGLTDLYHTPDDDVEKLNIPGMAQVADYADKLAWAIASMPERPKYVEVRVSSPSRGGMAYLGVVPDYGSMVEGLPVTGIKPRSPAEQGGLKEGDIIVRLGDVKVLDIEGLAEGLRKYKPGQTVEIVVKRGDMEITSTVVLGEPGSN